jgi:hypothetical protein
MRSYDPTEVSVTFNGVTIDGFGPDTFVEVTRNQDGWTYQPSNSGPPGARSRNPDRSGTITITLIDSSPANALLQAFADADELTGEGVGEFMVKDRGTATGKCTAQNAWVKKMPDWKRGKEVSTTVWVLESNNIVIAHDGLIDDGV